MDQFPGATLHAPETAHTLVINGVDHLPSIQAPIVVNVVDTLLLHTVRASQATFPPGDDARFSRGLEPVRGSLRRDHILGRHGKASDNQPVINDAGRA
jgi:hypothetical protein